MKKKITILLVSIALLAGGLAATSFLVVPHSISLYLASVATCENLEEVLFSEGDPQFKGAKFRETPLTLMYRLKYRHFGGPTKVSDFLVGESNVCKVFLTAADATGGACDDEILQLFKRYADGSRSLDDYDETGYTALHMAIVFAKTEFGRILLDGGADTSLVVHSDGRPIDGKSAVEPAIWFSEQEYSRPSSEAIATMLVYVG